MRHREVIEGLAAGQVWRAATGLSPDADSFVLMMVVIETRQDKTKAVYRIT